MNAVPRAAFEGRFDLTFARFGGRTRISRQYVAYPFHITRPFTLDRDIPALTTVYQQSASGGIYRADDLSSRIALEIGAAVHVTTQAATVVHDCQGRPARLTTEIAAAQDTFLAFTPDPCVFFPGAALQSQITARLAASAVFFLTDAFASHDPIDAERPFDHYTADLRILDDADGRLILRDNMAIAGGDLKGLGSPIGKWRIAAFHLFVGPQERLPSRDAVVAATFDPEAIGGVGALPNGAGWGVRVLAATAVANRRVAEALFGLAVHAALGAKPAQRRK
jgi:urease accessory protein